MHLHQGGNKDWVSLDDILAYSAALIASFQFRRPDVQHAELFCWRIVIHIHVLNCSLLSTRIAQYNNRNPCLRCQAFVANTLLQYAHRERERGKLLSHFLPSNCSPLWQSLQIHSCGSEQLLFEMLQLVEVNETAETGQHKNHYIETTRRVHGDLTAYINTQLLSKNKLDGYWWKVIESCAHHCTKHSSALSQ